MHFSRVRISLRDLQMAIAAIEHATKDGRGALTRTARDYEVGVPVVSEALDRIEAAFGLEDKPIFAGYAGRRTGRVTASGRDFHRRFERLAFRWHIFAHPTGEDDGEWLKPDD